MTGFICLDKQAGLSSFKAAAALRKITGEKKTGHTGTLDPMATGVLPVALGHATRFIDFIPHTSKAYTARFRTGFTTDTLDITGSVTAEYDKKVSRSDIEAALPRFTGHILQVPPMYSALSKDGVRLYELARRGEEVERQARETVIHSLVLTGEYEDGWEISVECSRGTYVRSLIDDIGQYLGCGGCMTALRRTASDGFSLSCCHTVEDIRERAENGGMDGLLISVSEVLSGYKELEVTAAQAQRFRNGGELDMGRIRFFDAKRPEIPELFRVFSPDGIFLGLGEADSGSGILNVKRVFVSEA